MVKFYALYALALITTASTVFAMEPDRDANESSRSHGSKTVMIGGKEYALKTDEGKLKTIVVGASSDEVSFKLPLQELKSLGPIELLNIEKGTSKQKTLIIPENIKNVIIKKDVQDLSTVLVAGGVHEFIRIDPQIEQFRLVAPLAKKGIQRTQEINIKVDETMTLDDLVKRVRVPQEQNVAIYFSSLENLSDSFFDSLFGKSIPFPFPEKLILTHQKAWSLVAMRGFSSRPLQLPESTIKKLNQIFFVPGENDPMQAPKTIMIGGKEYTLNTDERGRQTIVIPASAGKKSFNLPLEDLTGLGLIEPLKIKKGTPKQTISISPKNITNNQKKQVISIVVDEAMTLDDLVQRVRVPQEQNVTIQLSSLENLSDSFFDSLFGKRIPLPFPKKLILTHQKAWSLVGMRGFSSRPLQLPESTIEKLNQIFFVPGETDPTLDSKLLDNSTHA